MKNIRKISNTKVTASLCIVVFLSSCSGNSDTKKGNLKTDQRSKIVKKDDLDFLHRAAIIDLEAIELGYLAEKNGSSTEVIIMGELLVIEHLKSFQELQQLAYEEGFFVPKSIPENKQGNYHRLKDKTGSNFDKEFCESMILIHKNAIDMFKRGSANTVNSKIRSWAASVILSLKRHHEKLISYQKKVLQTNK